MFFGTNFNEGIEFSKYVVGTVKWIPTDVVFHHNVFIKTLDKYQEYVMKCLRTFFEILEKFLNILYFQEEV